MKLVKGNQIISQIEVISKNLYDKESREITLQFSENELSCLGELIDNDDEFSNKYPEIFNIFYDLASKNK